MSDEIRDSSPEVETGTGDELAAEAKLGAEEPSENEAAPADDAAAGDLPRRRWPLWLLLPALAFGVFVGLLMTWHHERELYGGAEASAELIGCEESATVSCNIVNTSAHSEIFGVPIATLAIPTYLLFALLALAALRRRRGALFLLLLGGCGAVLYSAFLLWVSLSELGYTCAWCVRLYLLNAAVLVLALAAGGVKAARPSLRTLAAAGATFVVLLAVSAGAQRAYRSSLLGDAGDTLLAEHESEAEPAADEGPIRDPEGPAPAGERMIRTEDGNQAQLVIRPGDAWLGNPEATVQVVEFADLECGYCKRTAAQLERLYAAYADQVLFVFKHYPMDPTCNPGVRNRRHRKACQAGRAAVCAQRQGRFWEFVRLAFRNQHALSEEALRQYAEHAQLSLPEFETCMADPSSLAKVRENAGDGAAIDIHGTPRIYIQGQLYRAGASAEQMAHAIELALGRTRAEAASAVRDLADGDRRPIQPVPDDVPTSRVVEHGDLRFRMQTFEAALDDSGTPVSGTHEIPATHVSWYAARDACASVGMRLCTEQEWLTACQGAAAVDDDGDGAYADDLVEGTSYPYGDLHERGRCWDDHDGDDFRPVYTAEMPGCVSADGVYDLTGNVEEWAGRTEEEAVLLGGAFDTRTDHARCFRRNDTFGPGFANRRTGFRCCAD
jgi:protein-disulfide isomerase/uncharacterized membrane protein